MSKYLVEFKGTPASAILHYNPDGCLVYYEHEGEWSKKAFIFFFERFPFMLEHLEALKANTKFKIKVEEIPEDLSFERFWEEYANKKGKKSRVENVWNRMIDQDRIMALKYIKTYDSHLAMNKGIVKKYPETFLNAEEWNN